MVNLLIGGDLCPVNRNLRFFVEGDIGIIDKSILKEILDSDYFLINLECPLLKRIENARGKGGPIHGVPYSIIKGIKMLHVSACNLANNHILDFGIQGLNDTISLLKEENIAPIGIKHSDNSVKIKNVKIGFLSIVDTEAIHDEYNETFLTLSDFDLHKFVDKVVNVTDISIALVHAGISGYQWPSPYFFRFAHFLVDNGIDFVIFQHNHVPGIHEIYKGKHIIYGQGNFLFDIGNSERHFPFWHRGNLIKLMIDEISKSIIDVKLIPFLQSREFPGLKRIRDIEDDSYFRVCNNNIFHNLNIDKVKKKWEKYVERKMDDVLFNFFIGCNSKFMEYFCVYFHRKFPFVRKFITRRSSLVKRNYFLSETNREIMETIFKILSQK